MAEMSNGFEGLPEVLKVPQVADLLRLHVKTVYKKIGQGEIPHVRLGGAIRVPKAALRRLLEVETD